MAVKTVIDFLFDPKVFVYVILALYLAAALRFAVAGQWWTAAYWLSALSITITVTFGRNA